MVRDDNFFTGVNRRCSKRFFITTPLRPHPQVLVVYPTDKTQSTGERCVRFKALAVAGDCNGHVGLGVQIHKEVAVAIAGRDPRFVTVDDHFLAAF